MPEILNQNKIVKELFETGFALNLNNEKVEYSANMRLEFCEALYQTVLKNKPSRVIEIGMAFGTSALTILTALDKMGTDGGLISVDPFQSTQWQSCGLTSIKRADLQHRHRLIEKFDYLALPELLENNTTFDFAYIDGWHTFDYTLIDFWYIDKMLSVGGVVGINDCHLTAVTKVINFILSHRKYQEIQVGLPIQYNDYNPLKEPLRIIKRQPRETYYKQAQDRYFRKIEDFEPEWDFYAPF